MLNCLLFGPTAASLTYSILVMRRLLQDLRTLLLRLGRSLCMCGHTILPLTQARMASSLTTPLISSFPAPLVPLLVCLNLAKSPPTLRRLPPSNMTVLADTGRFRCERAAGADFHLLR